MIFLDFRGFSASIFLQFIIIKKRVEITENASFLSENLYFLFSQITGSKNLGFLISFEFLKKTENNRWDSSFLNLGPATLGPLLSA